MARTQGVSGAERPAWVCVGGTREVPENGAERGGGRCPDRAGPAMLLWV